MDNKSKKRSKSMGVCGSLVILFIILKIMDIISWSWLWVFSPIWITLITCVVALGLILVVGRIKKDKW